MGACGQATQKVIPFVIPPEDGANPVDGYHYATTCRECEAGCGVVVRTVNGRAKKIEGNSVHPISNGRACVKAQAAVQRVYHSERLTDPMVNKNGKFEKISWNDAIGMLVEKLKIANGKTFFLNNGANDALAGVVDSIFGEKGGNFIASNHDFGHESLIAGGSSLFDFPKIQLADMSNADFTILLGADMNESGVSPVYQAYTFGQSRRGRPSKRGRFVYCGSRLSPTAASADKWLPVPPGQLGLLALSIAQVVVDTVIQRELAPSVGRDTLMGWRQALNSFTPEKTYKKIEVKADYIRRMAAPFVDEAPALMVAGDGVVGFTNGTSSTEAIEFVNMLSAEIGREKTKLSQAKTLQSNPTLKAALQANFGLAPEKQSFRRLKILTDGMVGNEYKVGIISHTNPVFDTPKSLKFKEALANVPFKVSFSCFMDETTVECNLVLPDNHWLESWSAQLPNFRPGVPILNLVQPTVVPFLNTKQAGDVLLEAAAKAGIAVPAKNLESFIGTVIEKNRAYLKDVPTALDTKESWNHMLQSGGWWPNYNIGGQAETPKPASLSAVSKNLIIEDPSFDGDDSYQFYLHPYKTAHMGRGNGANQAWMHEAPDPVTTLMWQFWIEVNPVMASTIGVVEGDIVKVASPYGSITGPVFPFAGLRPDVIAVPVGYGHTKYGELANNVGSNAMNLLGITIDKTSGALAFRSQKVSITKDKGSVMMMRNAHPRGEYKGEIFQL